VNILRIVTVLVPYFIASAIYLVAQFLGNDAVTDFVKPLLMPLLLAGFLFSVPRIRSEIALLGAVAITLSWLGDVTLGSVGEIWFLVGLGFFLLAHIAYIVLFTRRLMRAPIRTWALAYLVWWVALVAILWPHLGNLLLPVAVYGLVLGLMGAVALSCNRWVAIGGALFVVSDSLLGINRFHPDFEWGLVHVAIMLTYITAQGLIAWGAVRSAYEHDLRRSSASVPAS